MPMVYKEKKINSKISWMSFSNEPFQDMQDVSNWTTQLWGLRGSKGTAHLPAWMQNINNDLILITKHLWQLYLASVTYFILDLQCLPDLRWSLLTFKPGVWGNTISIFDICSFHLSRRKRLRAHKETHLISTSPIQPLERMLAFWLRMSWRLSQLTSGERGRCTIDRSPANHRAQSIHLVQFFWFLVSIFVLAFRFWFDLCSMCECVLIDAFGTSV